tara:strand:+ start:115 stop:402 length:288 start_codon:yes stop_codon:yes gene_type:complete
MPNTVHRTTADLFEWSDENGDRPAIRLGCSILESDMPSDGAAVSVVKATLSDGTERVILLYSVAPERVPVMCAGTLLRTAIANDIKAAADALISE